MPDNRQAKRQHPLALPSRDAPVSASLRYLLSTRVAHRNWWHTQRSWKEGRVTRLRRAKGPPRRWPPRAGSGTSRPRGPLCPTRPAPLRPAMAVRDPNHEQRSEALDPPRAPTGPVSPRPSCGGKRACDNRNRLEDGGSHPTQIDPNGVWPTATRYSPTDGSFIRGSSTSAQSTSLTRDCSMPQFNLRRAPHSPVSGATIPLAQKHIAARDRLTP